LPAPSQWSSNVHALPSSHDRLVVTVTLQLDVPLQARVAHASLLQVMGVPPQPPEASHTSLYVQGSKSLHAVPAGASEYEHAPSTGSQVGWM
jgi:hypothetical protein